MNDKGSTERPAFTAYALALALGGLLLAAVALRDTGDLLANHLEPVACFALFIGMAWRFPFSILPRARMSMDYVFIIAALAVLPQPLPYMVGVGAAFLVQGTFLLGFDIACWIGSNRRADALRKLR